MKCILSVYMYKQLFCDSINLEVPVGNFKLIVFH